MCLIFGTVLFAEPKGSAKELLPQSALSVDNTTYIDANRILMFVTNHGNFGRDLGDYFGYDYGTFFPYAGNVQAIFDGVTSAIRSPLYSAGLWIGGIDSASESTLVAISEYNSEFVPGPMSGGTFQTDIPQFRVYKLYTDSLLVNPNTDYNEYLQYAVPQGAPYEVYGSDTIPEMLGDQMLWTVYNDANPASHTNNSGETAPMGIEVKQTVFAFAGSVPQQDIVFLRWQLFNKGTRTIENFFTSIWADPDLGGSGDDLVGVDTYWRTGFCYNDNNADQFYADRPPCLGIALLQGPAYFTGNSADSARSFGYKVSGYRNIGLTAFSKYINGTDPDAFWETYNYMQGLNRDGSDYTYNGSPTTFMKSGDPVSGTGDIDMAPDDRRFMLSTGPITFRPGDSTEIIAAVVVGQGSDRLNSITIMKQRLITAYSTYYSLIREPLDADDDSPPALPSAISLEQNYPNPFNPETTIEFSLRQSGPTNLTIYNILGEVIATPINRQLMAGPHAYTWSGTDDAGNQVTSGIYFYKLSVNGSSESKQMILLK